MIARDDELAGVEWSGRTVFRAMGDRAQLVAVSPAINR